MFFCRYFEDKRLLCIIIKYKYSATVDNTINDLERCNKVRDLGVIVDSKLSFTDHITVKVNKAYTRWAS